MEEPSLFKRKLQHDTFTIKGRRYEVYRVVERKREPAKRVGGWRQAYKKGKWGMIPIFTIIMGSKLVQPHMEAD